MQKKYAEANLTVIAALCARIWLKCVAPKTAFLTPQGLHWISSTDSKISRQLLHVVFGLAE